MQELEIVVVIGVAILLGQMTATRMRLAPPIVLMVLGVAITFIPGMGEIGLPAEIVLMVFLPILLYWDSLGTSMREVRRMRRAILLNATLLVVFTAAAVALVAHLMGLSWGSAWIIGAAVGPTDATAVAVLGGGLSRTQTATLKAESLGNDGTALVIFALAIEFATGSGHITVWHATGMFALSFFGGVAIGLVIGWLIAQWSKHIAAPIYITLLMVLTPFIAYLVAEAVHASGVLAVVVCGLYMSQVAPRLFSAASRQVVSPFWGVTTFILNGALFVLVGAQLPDAIEGLSGASVGAGLGHALLLVLAVYVTTLVSRFVFINLATIIIRMLDRRPQQRALRSTWRGRVVSTLAGFRGAVSMAVALSVPMTLANGSALPDRGLIVLATAGTVVLSLTLQGLVFPLAVRWGSSEGDGKAAHYEAKKAWRAAWEAVLESLPRIADREQLDDEVVSVVQRDYEGRLRRLKAHLAQDSDPESEASEKRFQQVRTLKLRALQYEREMLVRLRDQRVIDDPALREMMAKLDAEEVRLTGPVRIE